MQQNFTESVNQALQAAFTEAQNRKNSEVTENHLLLGFLKEPRSYFLSLLSNLNANPHHLVQKVEEELNRSPTFAGSTSEPPNAGRSLQSRIVDAQQIAKQWQDSY